MANEKRTTVSGRQTLEFDLLDETTRKAVLKCIEERGKISVVIEDRGPIHSDQLSAFKQLID